MLYFLIAAVVAAVTVFHIFIYHQYNYPWVAKIIDKIPGPSGIFYFGSTLQFQSLRSEERLDEIASMFHVYGSTFRYWFSGVPSVFISELDDYQQCKSIDCTSFKPDSRIQFTHHTYMEWNYFVNGTTLQVVLGSRLNSYKGNLYKHILPWLGRGLLTSDGSKWRHHRKIITPTFHFSILQGFVEVFNSNTKILLKRLERRSGQTTGIDLCKYVTCCTLDNVCETAMGTSVNAQSGAPSVYVDSVFRLGKIVAERLFSPIFFSDHTFNVSPLGWEHNRILKNLHGFTNRVINECKAVQEAAPGDGVPVEETSDANVGSHKRKLTFLQMLLENQEQNNLSDKDIREEVDTFMFEGHDTTSMGITWTLFELGCHPVIQQRCYEEQLLIFEDSERQPSYQDVTKMNYLKQVVYEALRLHPSVPVISRRFLVDLQLKDFLVPAGTEIVMDIHYHHRNPTVYPDPEKFDPDRFLPERANARHSFAYLPFSAGLRNCVGQKFAMLELLIVISSIIRKFSLESLDKRETVKGVPEMTLRPAETLTWRITPRQKTKMAPVSA